MLPSKQMYNGLILAHAKRDEPIEAEKVLREMKENGLEPDIVWITTVIGHIGKLEIMINVGSFMKAIWLTQMNF